MTKHQDPLNEAYNLRSAAEVADYYTRQAHEYDALVHDRIGYVVPKLIALFVSVFGRHSAPVIDLGCGTGAVAEELRACGFSRVDGVDFSPGMLEVAKEKGLYDRLFNFDVNHELGLPTASYGAAVSVGAFSYKHIEPCALDEISRVVEPSGIICFTVNERVFEEYGFEEKFHSLKARNQADVIAIQRQEYHAKEGIDAFLCALKVMST